MKTKSSLCASLFLIIFFCMGCSHSQQLLISQHEFSGEMSGLKVGSTLSVKYGSGPKYDGVLVEPMRLMPDSSYVIVMETSPGKPWQQFVFLPTALPTVSTQISMRRNPDAKSILANALICTAIGAGVGAGIGALIESNNYSEQNGLIMFYGADGTPGQLMK